MQIELIVGQSVKSTLGAGSQAKLRGGGLGDVIASELNGRYYENTYRGNKYILSQIALGSTIVAGNVSPVGAAAAVLFAMYNPLGNAFNAVINRILAATISGTPGGPLALNVIAPPAGITAAANLTPVNAFTLKASGSTMLGFTQTALTGGAAGTILRTLGGPAAIAAGAGLYAVDEEVAGSIIVPPGGALVIAATATGTTHIVSCAFEYDELPV